LLHPRRESTGGEGGAAGPRSPAVNGQRAYVVHPALPIGHDTGRGRGGARQEGAPSEVQSTLREPAQSLDEAMGLARAIGLQVVMGEVLPVRKPRPQTLIGGGQVSNLAEAVATLDVALVVVDAALTPGQQRNLETALGCKVIDRTGLILEIFGARARTREGRLQVELAHLTYQRSRLVRSWTHLERQRGGAGFLGGPGERQLEIDRRLIDERIARIKLDLEQVVRTRGLHRESRQKVPYPVVALVGYTNAGKSTLFNRLTQAEVTAADMLFATLDPTMRAIALPGGRTAILSDTVGFISNLPTQLVAAFRATLEEVLAADVIVHVRDASADDSAAQAADVAAVLAELGIDMSAVPVVEVMNKIDNLSPSQREHLAAQESGGADAGEAGPAGAVAARLSLSALTGEGVDALLQTLSVQVGRDLTRYLVTLAPEEGAALSWLYRHGEVIARRDTDSGAVELELRLRVQDYRRFRKLHAGRILASGPVDTSPGDTLPTGSTDGRSG